MGLLYLYLTKTVYKSEGRGFDSR